MSEEVRLQKYLAECGIASRRRCEKYITAGRVKVNGVVESSLGKKIVEGKDIVLFDDTEVKKQNNRKIYILLNKPIGYVTTVHDQFKRDTVMDLVKVDRRIVPVGRLDMYTSGAIILTDDGDFVYRVTHPKNEITKTYTVTLKGEITNSQIEALREGVIIDEEYKTKPAKVRVLKNDKENNKSRLEIIIHEGKNRQVRKMCEAVGKKVLALHRSKIGDINVKDLKIGTWRYLKQEELKQFYNTKLD